MKSYIWYLITVALFAVGLWLTIGWNQVQAAFSEEVYFSVPAVFYLQTQPIQDLSFLWWSTEVFVLGFMGYVSFGIGSVALSNPLASTRNRKFRIPSINLVLLHLMVAGTAGVLTVLLQNNPALSAFLTGSAYLALISSFGPEALKLHKGN